MSKMRIVVALMRNPRGDVLVVRKRGTAVFMQPGGKIEPDEDARSALLRELGEELGFAVDADSLTCLGQAEAPAANEPGVIVAAEIFGLRTDAVIAVQAEIAEAVWIDPAALPEIALAPLTRDHILPLALAGA